MKNLKLFPVVFLLLFTFVSSCAQTSSETDVKKIAKATKSGDIEIIKKYLEGDVDINALLNKEKYPYTLLCSSIKYGNEELVEFLIEKNADLELQSNKKTPLMYAAKYGHLKIVKILLQRGVDVNKKSPKGRTALDYAKRGKYEEVISTLERAMKID